MSNTLLPPSAAAASPTPGSFERYINTLPLASRDGPPSVKQDVVLPQPLLDQLARPINNLDDVQSLVDMIEDARARGCF